MSVRDHDPINKAYPGLDIVSDKVDAEFDKEPTHDTLKRQLKNRHVAMIRYFPTFFTVDSLRLRFVREVLEVRKPPRWLRVMNRLIFWLLGVIGTGLFLSTATSLKDGGPLGLLLGYIIVGTICYSVMVSRAVRSPVPFF
jgi:hypothetical protein